MAGISGLGCDNSRFCTERRQATNLLAPDGEPLEISQVLLCSFHRTFMLIWLYRHASTVHNVAYHPKQNPPKEPHIWLMYIWPTTQAISHCTAVWYDQTVNDSKLCGYVYIKNTIVVLYNSHLWQNTHNKHFTVRSWGKRFLSMYLMEFLIKLFTWTLLLFMLETLQSVASAVFTVDIDFQLLLVY